MEVATTELIRRLDGLTPRIALVLGSGLGNLVDQVSEEVRIPFSELPGFPESGVSGHAGEVVVGHLGGKQVLILSGRVHYYENGKADAMRVPIEALQGIGIDTLVLTNSAGSLVKEMQPGSVMMINDHINWSGINPLIGEPTDRRFVGMTNAYDPALMKKARDAAQRTCLHMHEGVYMWFSGPSFETPAEISAARRLGADAVGMSTVPEVILARFAGLNACAFSVITNYGAGMTGDELSHDETKEMAPMGGRKLGTILAAMIEGL